MEIYPILKRDWLREILVDSSVKLQTFVVKIAQFASLEVGARKDVKRTVADYLSCWSRENFLISSIHCCRVIGETYHRFEDVFPAGDL